MRMGFGRFQIMLILQGVLLAGLAIADAGVENNIERSFQVVPGGRLTVDADRGTIEVRTANRDFVDVEIERKVKRSGKWSVEKVLEDFVITFDHSDNEVAIKAKYDRKNLWRSNRERNRLRIKFLITVPQQYSVDLKTLGAGISVEDLEGEVRGQTSGGGLRFGRIKGPVWGRTVGGGIKLEGTQGDVDVKTSGGGITIGSVEGAVEAKTAGGSIRIDKAGGSVNAKTSGGGITIGSVEGGVEAKTAGGSIRIDRATGSVNARTSGGGITVEEVMGNINAKAAGGSIKAYISRQPEGDCSLETSGGSVTAYLVEDIAIDVDAQTSGGHVSTDVPIIVQGKISGNRLQGAINDGGPLLKLRAFGGSIHLRKKFRDSMN